eukprot:CFRG7124T1
MKQQSLRIAFVPKKRALFDRDGCPKQDAKRVAIHTNSSKSGKNVVPVSKTCQASPPPRSSLKSWLTASSVPGSNLGPETIKRSQERRLIRKTQQTTLDVAQRTLARPTKGLNTPPPKDAALKKMSNPQLDSSGEGPSTPLRVVHGPTKLAASSYTPYKCPTAITPRRKDITPARVSEKIGAGVNPGDIQIALNEHVAGNCCKADSGAVSPSSTPPMIHVNFSAPTTPQRSAAAVLLYLPNMTAPEDGAGHKARMRMMGRSPPKTMKQLGTTTRPMLSSRNLFGAARNSTPIFQNDVPDEATSDSFDLREKSVSLTAGTDSDEWAFVQNEATTCKISCPKQELTEVAKTGDPSVNLDVRVNIAASTMKDGADAGVSANGSAKSKIAYVSKIETVENVGMDKATTVGQNERATSEVPLSRSEKLFAAVAGKNKTTNTRASSRVQSSLAHVLPTTPTKSTHTYRDSSVSTHTHTHKSAHTQSHLDKDVVTTVGSGGTRLTEIQKQFTNRQIHRRLPPSYELLSQMQSALDLALRHRKARKENLTFERAKVWIEESLHKTFAEKHLKQIVSVWPEIYTLQRELSQKRTELQTAQTYRDKFMLLIDGDLSFTTPQGNTLPSSIRTIQQRQSLFRLLLLKRTLELHRGELCLYECQLSSGEETSFHLQWVPVEPECFGDDIGEDPLSNSTSIWQSVQQHNAHAYALDMDILELQSICKNVPTIGFSNIVLQLLGGVTLPPLYFHGGYQDMKRFFEVLGDHVDLTRDVSNAHLYVLPRGIHLGHHHGPPVFGNMYSMRNHALNVLDKISQASQYAKDTVMTSRAEAIAKQEPKNLSADDFGDDFELVSNGDDGVSSKPLKSYAAPPTIRVEERIPITMDIWTSFQTEEGKIADPVTMRALIFANGVAPEARNVIWKYLLDYYPWDCSEHECVAVRKQKEEEYYIYKRQWMSITDAQANRFRKYRDRTHRIEKDVSRTDRQRPMYRDADGVGLRLMRDILVTYGFYNFDLAYVQGMSDILGPILEVMDDEVDAFWCFAGIMDRVEQNFQKDQNGVHIILGHLRRLLEHVDPELMQHFTSHGCENLFFCFRWIIIDMKREFDFESIQKLWEVNWTKHESHKFCLFVYCAILIEHRVEILSSATGFDGILKFINDLALTVDVEKILARATVLCKDIKHSAAGEDICDLYEVPPRKTSGEFIRKHPTELPSKQ